ncbi:MAG: hypothetical protein LBF94_00020 [Puniceicoccales bacterium]|jgi:hypothetical protein|nr:hypothetical protein [Puniceicoccales bacterium]
MTKENYSMLLNGIKFFKNPMPLAIFMDFLIGLLSVARITGLAAYWIL